MSCVAITKAGTPCSRKKKYGDFCGQHNKVEAKIEETITITFGDVAENHVGMEKIGKILTSGLSTETLKKIKKEFEKENFKCELIDLNTDEKYEEASLLIIRNVIETADLMKELKALEWDTKAKMYGRVVNKSARYNLCFADYSQEPDYENGKGRVVSFDELPHLKELKKQMEKHVEMELVAEGNYYYDSTKTGISFHGDSERRVVVALRLGATMPLVYQWYQKGERVGEAIRLNLNDGDVYIMSDKAVGNDWKKKNIYTLRHSAGAEKFIS